MRILLPAVVLLALLRASSADTVVLAKGGAVEGVICELALVLDGTPKTFLAGQFSAVQRRDNGAFVLRRPDGAVDEGHLASVQVKTVAGMMTFKGTEVSDLVVEQPDDAVFANGNKVSGAIVAILVTQAGAEKRIERGRLRALRINPAGPDTVQFCGGATEEAEVLSVEMLTPAGLVKLAGTELVEVVVRHFDDVLLKTGARLAATVEEVALRQPSGVKRLQREQFAAVELGAAGADVVRLRDGAAETGDVATMRARVAGGTWVLPRADIMSVTIRQGAADELRQAYLAQRAKTKDDDPDGLCQLAAWCREKGLDAESRELAERCLKANPSADTAALAHRLLGHVLRDGQWVAPSAPEPQLKDNAVDPALLELGRKVIQDYAAKVDDAKDKDAAAIRAFYQADWEALLEQIRDLQAAVNAAERQRDQLRAQAQAERNRTRNLAPQTFDEIERVVRADYLDRDYEAARDEAVRLQRSLTEARIARGAMETKIKAAQARASDRANARANALDIARSRLRRLLASGDKPTEAEMRSLFDEALKDTLPPSFTDRPGTQPRKTEAPDARLVALLNSLAAEYAQKADRAERLDRDAARRAFEGDLNRMQDRVRSLERDLADAVQKRDAVKDNRPAYDQANQRVKALEAMLDLVKREQADLVRRAREALAKVRDRATERERRLATARRRIEQLIPLDKKPTEAEMRAMFNDAIKD